MNNIKIKKLNDTSILISNIWELNDENYIDLIKLEKEHTEEGISHINISISIQDMENIKFLLNNGYYFKSREKDKYILEKMF